ncbi:DUF1129 domain-containing protein [Fructilactobacillus myrtifloralis]|uniref:DUF1129 domain-containing protein n=1 Tax=Fructilactobacillus myrtifloralis TaxID=2940301 RepID=A0ABY5BNR0_9LACO|nr:DUF1129 family protein [Fructilactobacillus myrtifloralis]USS84841.1 DUF1129 domain-containing protein [Fructilactobacillus myrtifloralis]
MATEKEKRNAHVQQRPSSQKERYAEFANQGLTKRNEEYMVKFSAALADTNYPAEQRTELIQTMMQEILAAQKRGTTAKNLYGTVTEKLKVTLNPPKEPAGPMTKERYLTDATYNFLWFLILFNFMYGAMAFMAPDSANQAGAAGITCIVLSSIVAGLGMPFVTQLFAPDVQHKHNWLVRAGMMALMFLVWMLVFYGSNLLPRIINPVVNPIVNIVIGVIGVVAILYMRSRFKITSGIFAGRR